VFSGGVIGLIPSIWNHQHWPACSECLSGRSRTSLMHIDRRARKHLRVGCIWQGQNIWCLNLRDYFRTNQDCASLQTLRRSDTDPIKITRIMHCRGTLRKNDGRVAAFKKAVQ
jgi:hypothetical protein